MRATVLDTKTGLTEIVDGTRSWEWAENNFCCDCNRNPWGVETGKPSGLCEGFERFVVIKAEMNSDDDYEYTLAELNSNYPVELLRSVGILK